MSTSAAAGADAPAAYSNLQSPSVLRRGTGGRSSVSGHTATVFGATGSVGRYLVNALGETGTRITIPARGDEDGWRHLRLMGDIGQITFVPYSIRDKDHIAELVEGSTLVFNLLGRDWETHNFSFEDVNVDAAQAVAEACAKSSTVRRLVHCSALGASADSKSALMRSKFAGEEAVKAAYPDATIVRPGTLFGRGDRLLSKMVTNINNLPFVPLVEGGNVGRVQPTHVVDVAVAMKRASDDVETVGKTYEIAGPDVFSWGGLYKRVAHEMRADPTFLPVPMPIARVLAMPRDYMVKKAKIPWYKLALSNTDFLDRLEDDKMVLSGEYPGFEELGVVPRPLGGQALDYIRHRRSGGYDGGATLVDLPPPSTLR